MGVNSPLVYIIYISHQLAGTRFLFQKLSKELIRRLTENYRYHRPRWS